MAAAYLKHPGLGVRRSRRSSHEVRVTDHALVRWLSRVKQIDMEFFREEMARTCAGAATVGATRLRTDECDFVMLNGSVITVLVDGATV